MNRDQEAEPSSGTVSPQGPTAAGEARGAVDGRIFGVLGDEDPLWRGEWGEWFAILDARL